MLGTRVETYEILGLLSYILNKSQIDYFFSCACKAPLCLSLCHNSVLVLLVDTDMNVYNHFATITVISCIRQSILQNRRDLLV